MRNLIIAIGLSVLAILIAFANRIPQHQQNADPAAVAHARAVIEELPLPQSTKDAYYARLMKMPETHLPYLVEEARHSVSFRMDARACPRPHSQGANSGLPL